MKEKECKYCGTKENLWTNKNGVIYNCCKVCYDTTEEKLCRYCGTKENLRTNKNGVIYNCCKHCYETIEVPNQIRKAGESFRKKYGVVDLGELRQKRLKEHPPKPKEKKKVVCKYCGTSDNLIELSGAKRTNCYPACKDHWDRYQEDKHEARKKSNMDRYGHEHPMDVPEFREKQVQAIHARSSEDKERILGKRKETNIEKFGVEFPIQLSEMKEKREETCIERFGVTNPTKLERVKDKQKETTLKKYGVTNPMQSEEIKNKAMDTNKERYGSKCPLANSIIKSKAKETLKNNYGVEHPMQSTIIKNKLKATNIKKYGCESSFGNKDVQRKSQITSREHYWNLFIKLLDQKKLSPLFYKEEYVNNFDKEFTFKCNRCEKEFQTKEITVQRINCGCLKSRSSYEDEIIDWLILNNIIGIEKNKSFYENSKKRYEVDIFLLDYSLGIEFHGLYWHSNLYVDKMYHRDKCLYFKNKGISLIQIFENEWENKQDIVQSLIRNKLKINKVLYARDCSVQTLSDIESKIFLEINHLSGYTPSKINISLSYNNSIVALGTFGKSRYSKQEEWELLRFCSLCNTTVVGGFNRILSYFEKNVNPKTLVSYIDLRYFNGNGYKECNFIQKDITDPNYFYFHPNKTTELYSRLAFQKHKLRSKLESFDPALSESENMINNGYLRIYDAGNLKMVKTY